MTNAGCGACRGLAAQRLPDVFWFTRQINAPPQEKKTPRGYRGVRVKSNRFDYLETDFLNMRSIFSLIASMAVEFACAVDRAWFAVLCAPAAAD